jgi:trigger factor
MQVTETIAEGLKREYKVVISAADFRAKMDSRLTQIGQGRSLPGFRPGKAPLSVLKQRFGKDVLGEVVQNAVNETTSQVVADRGLRPVGQPRVEILSADENKDLEYHLAVELMPEVKPMDFSGLSLERLVVDVPDDDVKAALDELAQRRRQSQPIAEARPAANGDILVVDFEGRVDGETFPGGSATGHYLELGKGTLIPGFEEQLVGGTIGNQIDVKVTFPDDYPAANLAGKKSEFSVRIQEIREAVVPALDDELAKSIGAENLDDLKTKMRQRLTEDYAVAARAKLKRELLDLLDRNHDFLLPPNMVEGEFNAIWSEVETAKQKNALDPDDVGKSEEQLKSEYRDIAQRRVRLGLLLSEVGRINNVQVGNDELQRAIMAEARRFPGQERKVMEFYQGNPAALAQVRAPLYEDKVVDFIASRAQVSERHVSPSELVAAAAESASAKA